MTTDEEAYEEIDRSDANGNGRQVYAKLALAGRVINCTEAQPEIERTSVMILDTTPTADGAVYPKVRITGVLRAGSGIEPRLAGFADEDHKGSPHDCFILEGRPPNVGDRWVSAVGQVGYIGNGDWFFAVDAQGHDLRFEARK